MGLKPAARIQAFVSSVKAPYHEATQLVLPLHENRGKICKKKIIIIKKKKEKKKREH